MDDSSTLEFTELEAQLIERYFQACRVLATREREQQADAQRQFVAMCEDGEGRRGAESEQELAYLKHMRNQLREREAGAVSEGIPQYEGGLPMAGWCADSDWKMIRSGNAAESKNRRN